MKEFPMRRVVTRIILSAFILLIVPIPAHADSEAPNFPNVRISRHGTHYSKSIPSEPWGTKGKTRIFRVGKKKKDVLIQQYAWYAPDIYLEPAEDGIYVVRPGPWARGREASAEDLAIEFYKNDRLLKRYSTLDLSGDPGNVSPTFSHYTVIQAFQGFRYEEGLTVFGIILTDGRPLHFNADTGEIINPLRDERRYDQTVQVGNNLLLGLKVVNETDEALDIEVEYNYDPQEEDWANLSADLLRKGGNTPFTGFVPARLVPGKNKALIPISLNGSAPDCFTTDEIEVTMYRKKGYAFLPDLAKRLFPYEKTWARSPEQTNVQKFDPDAGTGSGYARIGAVRVIRETNDALDLEVHYVYDPQESRLAQLSAGTYLEPGSPNHNKQIPVRLEPGFKPAVLKIERSPMAPVEYKTDRIIVVITGNYLSDQPDDHLFVSETFLYPKIWSQFPIAGQPSALSGQPLPRLKKGKEISKRNCSLANVDGLLPELRDLSNDVRQAVYVTADDPASADARVDLWARNAEDAWQRMNDYPIAAVIGRNGLAPIGEKHEGDGRTPSGTFSLRRRLGMRTRPQPGLRTARLRKWIFGSMTRPHRNITGG